MATYRPTHTEAPASWTARYVTEDGHSFMLTLRGDSGADLLPKTQAALAWLQDRGGRPEGAPAAATNGTAPGPEWCAIHGVAMRPHEKDGQAWYSHKAPDSTWCRCQA